MWKLVPILRQYRPDLAITVLDAPPTGLVLVTGLDPSSRVLWDNYGRICAEYSSKSLGDYGLERLFAEADIRSTQDYVAMGDIARHFWL